MHLLSHPWRCFLDIPGFSVRDLLYMQSVEHKHRPVGTIHLPSICKSWHLSRWADSDNGFINKDRDDRKHAAHCPNTLVSCDVTCLKREEFSLYIFRKQSGWEREGDEQISPFALQSLSCKHHRVIVLGEQSDVWRMEEIWKSACIKHKVPIFFWNSCIDFVKNCCCWMCCTLRRNICAGQELLRRTSISADFRL